ncbi:MAG: SIR2 family protein [Burkholderiales bacterium]|nr:SIR2 family protein [Burkholderiales bacterium]
MSNDRDAIEQIEQHLMSPNQAWLLGAGISKNAGVPLMDPLTDRVRKKIVALEDKLVLDVLFEELPVKSHVEHLLSHLGDYVALAERAKHDEIKIGASTVKTEALRHAHAEVVQSIAETVRWGYRPAHDEVPEQVGGPGQSIISIDEHRAFVQTLFRTTQAGLQERRGPVRLFTTNYDTLIEDALSLCSIPYWDGFSGGAVAFRNFSFGEAEPATGHRAHLIKLHGSIDWRLGDDGRVWRVRDGDQYPATATRVLIHPQSTKYTATQRDPFAAQFDLLRRSLATKSDNVLAVCGYSFGDEHINLEIEYALSAPDNRTTAIAFLCETNGMPDCITKWRASSWAKRLYVVTDKGVYAGSNGPLHADKNGGARDWWTFSGVTKLLKDGAGGQL